MKRSIMFIYIFLSIFLMYSCYQSNIWNKTNDKRDDTSPTVISAEAVNNTQVLVIFSEDVDILSAEDPANYSIAGLSMSSAARDNADHSNVVLTTSSQLGIEYELVVTGILDEFLNEIEAQNTAVFMGDALPSLLSAAAVNNTTVRITFPEPVTGADDAEDYAIVETAAPANSLSVSSVSIVSETVVELTTASQSGISYTLTASNILDANSNEIDPAARTAVFTGDALPYLVSAVSTSYNTVRATFSEDVDAGADVVGNYVISSGTLTVYSVSVSGNIVDLTTGTQTSYNYFLVVNNVYDANSNLIDASSNWDYFYGDPRPYVSTVDWDVAGDVAYFYVIFSEEVDETEATTSANYTISGSIIVSSVTKIDTTTYELITDLQEQGTDNYSLTVANIHDITGNANVIDDEIPYSFDGKDCPYIDLYSYDFDVINNKIKVVFSNKGGNVQLNVTSATTEGNYVLLINGTPDSISLASVTASNEVQLDPTTPLDYDTTYTLTISIIDDNYGNLIRKPNEIIHTTPSS